MNKALFEKTFNAILNKNFQNRSKYFDFDFHVFNELAGLVNEINSCLIFEFHHSAITLTNNLLERLLKLALIYNEVGIGPKPIEDWGNVFEGPNKKYSSITLGNSIEYCKKLELITANEKTYLFETIRELFRNGFSHADPSKILNSIPDKTTMFHGSFSNHAKIKPVTVNQKVIPFIQAIHIECFAKENAANYFDSIFDLILRLEQRLSDNYNMHTINNT